jgi:hypothetical protein
MWLASALASFLVAIVLHAVTGRIPLIANAVIRFLAAGGAVGLALIAWLVDRYGLASAELWSGAAIYAFLCQLYIFLFTMTLGSISANLLVHLSRGPLRLDEVEQLYAGRRMVEFRIARLIGTSLLAHEAEGLALTPRGLRTVAMYRRLRSFFKHDAAA